MYYVIINLRCITLLITYIYFYFSIYIVGKRDVVTGRNLRWVKCTVRPWVSGVWIRILFFTASESCSNNLVVFDRCCVFVLFVRFFVGIPRPGVVPKVCNYKRGRFQLIMVSCWLSCLARGAAVTQSAGVYLLPTHLFLLDL